MDRKPNAASVRVLNHPAPSTRNLPASSDSDSSFCYRPPLLSHRFPSSPPLPRPHSHSSSSSASGIVVVGFIGRIRCSDVFHLINRITDSDVFGSTNHRQLFSVLGDGSSEEVQNWFKSREICYFHDKERDILYLQICSTKSSGKEGSVWSNSNVDFVAEEHEFGDLQGLLFLFNVCHLIIHVQEGSCFDVDLLRRIRLLQSAKLAMTPFVRSRNAQASLSKTSSTPSLTSTSGPSRKNLSPGRSGVSSARGSWAMSMSGLGSYASLLPGQCTPVMLFVFFDDFSDIVNFSATAQVYADLCSSTQGYSSSLRRLTIPMKSSGPQVVLARSANKGEGVFKKKLQSSLEAQIRFLIKKCRTLTGSEVSHPGSRHGSVSSSAPLLTLDASRAVVLLDSASHRRGGSLDFACGLVEGVLNGIATSDSLLLENHSENSSKEDIGTLKEFIYRQADILRGNGVSSCGSAAGVGMAAVAAAAAAASAACGMASSTPKLPSFEFWLSSIQRILKAILSAKNTILEETEISRKKSKQRAHQVEGAPSSADRLDVAVSLLRSGEGVNTRFCNLWCEKMVRFALEIYLKDLPTYYPTSQHEAHLAKALRVFQSMVKGPSLQHFMNKLKDECISIWISGRQLCDAVSLSGRPCMHERHDVDDVASPHSSGFVFVHACACGRSRQLRADPFDFESANLKLNCYPDCCKLIPSLKAPYVGVPGPPLLYSWSVVQLGAANSYEPSKGLQQTGFSVNQKFLLKWTIVEERDNPNGSYADSLRQRSLSTAVPDLCTGNGALTTPRLRDMQSGGVLMRRVADTVKSEDRKLSFGRGFPNITMKKQFSEVVAGSTSDNCAFPPLQSKKHTAISLEKNVQRSVVKDGKFGHPTYFELESSEKAEGTSSLSHALNEMNNIDNIDRNPVAQTDSSVVPLNMIDCGKSRTGSCLKHLAIYVGFEHECPHGHRFIMSPEFLDELGLPFLAEDSCSRSPSNTMKHKDLDASKSLSTECSKILRSSDSSNILHKVVQLGSSGDTVATEGLLKLNKVGMERTQTYGALDDIKDLHQCLLSVNPDDGGRAFSLLKRNVPIYMNCPHCRVSKNKKDRGNPKLASMVSQLQRIFVVTPSFPAVLVMNPVVQFEGSSVRSDISLRDEELQFGLGCPVILPPESFISVKLPFIYGIQLEHDGLCPLNPLEHRPEMSAWIKKCTTLQVMCKGNGLD